MSSVNSIQPQPAQHHAVPNTSLSNPINKEEKIEEVHCGAGKNTPKGHVALEEPIYWQMNTARALNTWTVRLGLLGICLLTLDCTVFHFPICTIIIAVLLAITEVWRHLILFHHDKI